APVEETGTTVSASASGGGTSFTEDPDVEVVWAQQFGGRGTDERATSVALTEGGALLLATIGAFELVEPTVRTVDEEDVLLARLTDDGEVTAARRLGGAGNDSPRALAQAADGGAFVLGTFALALEELDPPLVTYGGQTPFLARFAPDLEP